jgi:hypothetical protein
MLKSQKAALWGGQNKTTFFVCGFLLRRRQFTAAHPQSNGKQERLQGTVKREYIREKNPDTPAAARRVVGSFVDYYNGRRLHSAIGYVTPLDRLEGRTAAIHAKRERKLAEARERRKVN